MVRARAQSEPCNLLVLAPPAGPRAAGGGWYACACTDASRGTRPPALAVFLEPRGRAAAAAATKPRNSAKMSFGDLVLQPKAAAVAAGFTTKNGKKTQVKSGYRGVRQRPWGAPPRLPRAGTAACAVAPRARRRFAPRADAAVPAGKFAAEIRDPQHSTRLWLVRDARCGGAQAPSFAVAPARIGLHAVADLAALRRRARMTPQKKPHACMTQQRATCVAPQPSATFLVVRPPCCAASRTGSSPNFALLYLQKRPAAFRTACSRRCRSSSP